MLTGVWLVSSPMVRRCSCAIALAVMLVGLPTAQAADTTLTLACHGKETSKVSGGARTTEMVDIGVIVDLQNKTVTIGDLLPAKIQSLTETTITFYAAEPTWDNKGIVLSMGGTLDRITGSLVANSQRNEAPLVSLSYDLQCRPTQRMF